MTRSLSRGLWVMIGYDNVSRSRLNQVPPDCVGTDAAMTSSLPRLPPTRTEKSARATLARVPARPRLTIDLEQRAHASHRLMQSKLELGGKGHALLNAASKNDHTVGWANTVHRFDQRALRGNLHHVRGLNMSRSRLLLDGDQVATRTAAHGQDGRQGRDDLSAAWVNRAHYRPLRRRRRPSIRAVSAGAVSTSPAGDRPRWRGQ
jgi:hypothetical protein